MDLNFKGLITKKELEEDVSKLEDILKENTYAIIIDKNVGKYVVFDIDFVRNHVEVKEPTNPYFSKQSYTLVESMIKALEELPSRKTSAKNLSILVEKYYWKKASPVTIRTRAEENSNEGSLFKYFEIEPSNIIGLADGVDFNLYIQNKIKRAIDIRFEKLFSENKEIKETLASYEVEKILQSTAFSNYTKDYSKKDYKSLIESIGKYDVGYGYVFPKRK